MLTQSQKLKHDTIVLDSITIGEENNAELRGISYGYVLLRLIFANVRDGATNQDCNPSTRTGGYKFFPKELESAVAICELETVLSQDERPEIAGPPPVAGRNSNPVRLSLPPIPLNFVIRSLILACQLVNSDVTQILL